jgi:hypothetical protein
MPRKTGSRDHYSRVRCDGGDPPDCSDLPDNFSPDTESTDVSVSLAPDTVIPPETIRVTVRNLGNSTVKIYPDNHPVLYEETERGWSQVPVAHSFRFTDPVLVDEEYTYDQPIPFSNWDPEPGRYLFAVHIEDDGPERQEARATLVVE